MFGGIPAFGGHSLGGSIERAATLTAKDSRLDVESETFLVAPTLAGGGRKNGGYSYDDVPCVAATLDASYGRLQGCSGQDANHGHSHLVVHGTQDPCVLNDQAHTLGRNSGQENAVFAVVAGTLGANHGNVKAEHAWTGQLVAELSPTLRSGNMRNNSNPVTEADMLVAFTQNSRSEVRHIGGDGQIVGALAAEPGAQQQNYLAGHSQVRRLVPVECERLQGMADDYTLIPWRGKPASECPDGPRYKAIGNSKAVTVVRWIGRRLLRQLAD
jgi:DNA (cytosine-5)-methyltransferase 1